ncbi:hypothetical protein AB1Y20_016184 [Prymnesium parvum]|uniref:Reticulon-like protein n=1 Tax=Prymnesium parvum TaxID=97485 RepID=A0AB34IEL7_PRYPA
MALVAALALLAAARPEKAQASASERSSRATLEGFTISREDFLAHVRVGGAAVGGSAAEALWRHFEALRETRQLRLADDGSIEFPLPWTHHLAPYLPSRLTDALEAAGALAARAFRSLPPRARSWLHALLDAVVEMGLVQCALAATLTGLVVSLSLPFLFWEGAKVQTIVSIELKDLKEPVDTFRWKLRKSCSRLNV